MTPAKEKLKKLEDLFKMVNDSLTRSEFIESFKKVVELIVATKKELKANHATQIAELGKVLENLSGKLKSGNSDDVAKTVKEVNKAVLRVDDALKIQSAGMNLITDKVHKIKEGKDGSDGDRGDDGHTPTNQELLTLIEPLIPVFKIPKDVTNEIVDLKEENEKQQEEIEELKKRPIGRGGGTSAMGVAQTFKYIAHTEEPTGAIDGVNLTYTVLVDIWWIAGFTLNGENIAELPNYTFVNKVITFSTALPAAFSGKDFEVKYIG